MPWIVANMKWIMMVSGVLTSTMVYAAIAPEAALKSTFGESLEGPVAEMVVRNWGALITMIGGMLLYGAFVPSSRYLVLVIAGASKAVFIGLVLFHGSQYLRYQAGIAVVIDTLMVILFSWYLIALRRLQAQA